jgi:hypothetical protein
MTLWQKPALIPSRSDGRASASGLLPRGAASSYNRTDYVFSATGNLETAQVQMKIGRNDPCPCDSGKKYKTCCLSKVASPQLSHVGTDSPRVRPGPRISIDVGLGGTDFQVVAIPGMHPPDLPRGRGGPGGMPGNYKVIFILGRPGYPLLPEREFVGSHHNHGTSHVIISSRTTSAGKRSEIKINTRTADGDFELTGFANESGFLGTIVAESVFAQDARDARSKVSRAVAVSLNDWSTDLDVPLYVEQTETLDLRTGGSYTDIRGPHHEVKLHTRDPKPVTAEFLLHASLYREALNSNTRRYQFLCFYKIIEAIHARRKRLMAESKARREAVRSIIERVPSYEHERIPWLNALFPLHPVWNSRTLSPIFLPEAVGKKFRRIIDEYLRPLRNGIAHSVLDEGELVLSPDDPLDVYKITRWLPLTKCIARRMMKNEFPSEFLTDLNDDGS